jgi:Mn2+/Fe2+ NRAMP family transporter
LIVALVIRFPYWAIARVLKWLTFALFAYFAAAFAVDQNWWAMLRTTILPNIIPNRDFLMVLVALLGTTISPYLFFWQAAEEAEEERLEHKGHKPSVIVTKHELKFMEEDVVLGMFFSNLVMYFIIATTASTLFRAGIHQITTAQEAATALEPLAGSLSSWLFAAGLIGTGLLAIPVLAGSAAYVMAEAFGWREGLDKGFHQAKQFYLVIIVAALLGLIMNFLNLNPFRMLFLTAVIYGLLSPVLIAVILHMANKKEIMGQFTNSRLSNTLGGLTLVIMTGAAVALILSL